MMQIALVTFALLFLATPVAARADEAPPEWAYAITPRDDGSNPRPLSLPGSTRAFTRGQLTHPFAPTDWYPGDHPPMPRIVSHGRPPLVFACAFCHHPNGQGRPENSGVAGLPKAYIIQQMHDFRDGLRYSALASKSNTRVMVMAAQAMTELEIEAAAEYFSSIPWAPRIRVIETNTVPKTDLDNAMYVVRKGVRAGTEPIGERIVEVPEDEDRSEYRRDPRSGFVAYVPPGSLARGAELVKTGAGRAVPCASCHGENLSGVGDVPDIRGRSPSYVARQFYDFREGTRAGRLAAPMRAAVEKLSVKDITDVSAYLGSLLPAASSGSDTP